MALKVVIADDHLVVRSALKAILGMYPEFELIGETKNVTDAFSLTMEKKPDLLLLDIFMKEQASADIVRKLKCQSSSCLIVVLASKDELHLIPDMRQMGVDGFYMKEDNPDDIPDGIKKIVQGFYWTSPSFPNCST